MGDDARVRSAWGGALWHRGEVSAYRTPPGWNASFRGPVSSLAVVATIPGAFLDLDQGGVDFPIDAETLLALESFVPIERATAKYAELRDELLSVPFDAYPRPRSGQPPPYRYQVQALGRMAQVFDCDERDSPDSREGLYGFGNYLEQGMGKTRWTGDALRYLATRTADDDPIRLVLVVAKKIAMGQWEQSLVQCGWPASRVHVLRGSFEERRRALDRAALDSEGVRRGEVPHVVLANWQSISSLKIRRFRWSVVARDESHRAKDRTTATAQEFFETSARFRIDLTGTPIGESPADLWSQWRFTCPSLFGLSYAEFLDRYCVLGGFTMRQPVDVKAETRLELVRRLYSRAFRAVKATAFDMPEKTYQVVRVQPSARQSVVYRELSKRSFAEVDGARCEIGNALNRTMRLQQVTAGFLPTTVREDDYGGRDTHGGVGGEGDVLPGPVVLGDPLASLLSDRDVRLRLGLPTGEEESGEGGEGDQAASGGVQSGYEDDRSGVLDSSVPPVVGSVRVQRGRRPRFVDLNGAKLAYLREWVPEKLEEDPRARFLVFVQYRIEVDTVYAGMVDELGQERVAVTDGRTPEDRREEIRRAFNDRSTALSLWVMQIDAGAESLDVPSCDYVVYHSGTFSGIKRSQSEDRGYRAGRSRERPYTIVDLVVSGTVDNAIYRAALRKTDLQAMIATEGFNRRLERDDPAKPSADDPEVI